MGNKIRRIKLGMGGSRSGKGRSEKTAVMKSHSAKLRRAEGKKATDPQDWIGYQIALSVCMDRHRCSYQMAVESWESGELFIFRGRNGKKYVWYFDGMSEWAVEWGNFENTLNAEEIEDLLC
jgi:hypothetical protein